MAWFPSNSERGDETGRNCLSTNFKIQVAASTSDTAEHFDHTASAKSCVNVGTNRAGTRTDNPNVP